MSLSIAVIAGSLRRESYNRRLAKALIGLPEAAGHRFTFSEIADLPLYDQDQDDDQPAPAKRLKAEVRAADGVVFVTPEYNRSIPGPLKNAIDHASRPYGDSAWRGKPAAIAGITPGPMGTAMAQQHLRLVLAVLDLPTLGLPEVYFRYNEGFFAPDGSIADEMARGFAGKWMTALIAHFTLHSGHG